MVKSLSLHSTRIRHSSIIQGEHKAFPWLQTFITRKLRGIQNIFFTIT